jgi:peptidoglycan/LPS O-acetylase OafA/YrhL
MSEGRSKLGYVPALDGLWGVAIAIVVGFHLFGFPFGGQAGVDLFFAMSGFLITSLLLDELRITGAINLEAFYLRRCRRLVPALVALLAVYLIWDAARGRDGAWHVFLGGLYFSNFVQAFTHPNVLHGTGIDHLWSLAEEEQFYLVWPWVLLLLARSRRPLRWAAAVAIALLAYRTGLLLAGARVDRVYRGPDTHAIGLLGGSLLAFRPLRMPEWAAKLAVALFGLLAMVPEFSRSWWLLGQPLLELVTVVIVAAALSAPEFSEVLSARGLRWLGRISYSLYLWHWPIDWFFDGKLPLVVLLVSLAAASLSYRFIETPLRRRRHLETPAAPTAATA